MATSTSTRTKEILKPSDLDPTPEPVWYFITRRLYNGKFPAYYDMAETMCGKLLLDNYDAIRDELVQYWQDHGAEVSDEFFYLKEVKHGWKTMSLYASGYKHRKASAKLPVLASITEQIPLMTSVTVSVLEPGVQTRAHVGVTSGIIRTHLGIQIPAEPPTVAIRVSGYTRGWEEGKLFGIEMGRRHLAWNHSDVPRIAVIVDVVKDEFADQFDRVNGGVIGVMLCWMVANKLPFTKRLPEPVIVAAHRIFSAAATSLIRVRRLLRLQPAPVRG